jgi:two-component system OmpR family sensor kinase
VTELLVGLIVLTILTLLGYTFIRSSLRPLVRVEVTAAAIAGGDLTRRVPPAPERTEVGRLSGALNGMLAQIESAFQDRASSEAEARASEARMRRFIADASHELRTPLTAVRGFAELMRHGAVEGPMAADRIERAATRMSLLVDDLLLLARLDQQRALESRPVDLLALVVDAVADARVSAPDHPIELRMLRRAVAEIGSAPAGAAFAGSAPGSASFESSAPGLARSSASLEGSASVGGSASFGGSASLEGSASFGSPASPEGSASVEGDGPPVVRGDQAKLRQVIGNLITNAWQHTPPGTPVTVTLSTTADRAVLEVADAGPGLRPEDAERIFERFYRVDAARNSASGGSGLGLSIVAGIVAAHGGMVDVRSEPGEGSCFSINLPLLS